LCRRASSPFAAVCSAQSTPQIGHASIYLHSYIDCHHDLDVFFASLGFAGTAAFFFPFWVLADLTSVGIFYGQQFFPTIPPDFKLIGISRTIGDDQLVNEMIVTFMHTNDIPWLIPHTPPTNRYVEVPTLAVVHFRDDKLAHEHIYWDQASVLKQIGLLTDPSLPVCGKEAGHKLLEGSRSGRWVGSCPARPFRAGIQQARSATANNTSTTAANVSGSAAWWRLSSLRFDDVLVAQVRQGLAVTIQLGKGSLRAAGDAEFPALTARGNPKNVVEKDGHLDEVRPPVWLRSFIDCSL
jgi:hypothetical protein